MEFEQQIQELAQKALGTKDGSLSWWERIVAFIVIFAGLWWTKYQLAQRERQLAEAKAKLAQIEREVEWQKTKAAAGALSEQAKAELEKAELELKDMAAGHAERVTKLEAAKKAVAAISNWEDLNKLAGRTP